MVTKFFKLAPKKDPPKKVKVIKKVLPIPEPTLEVKKPCETIKSQINVTKVKVPELLLPEQTGNVYLSPEKKDTQNFFLRAQ